MRYVRLGSTGVKVSRICLGCMSYGTTEWRPWVLTEEEARPFIRRALEQGINFFDTADVYSGGVSEEILGRAIRDFAKRDQVIIASKVHSAMGDGPNDRGLSRKHILTAVEASLRRLGTDHIDLYQIHRFDPETPIEEMAEALDILVRSGKVRYIGASSMFAWQFMKSLAIQAREGLARFQTMQNHYNLAYREEEREMMPLCVDQGIGVIPWSPLARGRLAGSKSAGTPRSTTDEYQNRLYAKQEALDAPVIARCAEVAKERGVPPSQIALAWLLAKPGIVAPIVGATKTHHLDDAIAASELTLEPEEIKRLEEPYQPHPIAGHSYSGTT
ncbi:aldo/keto reductase [Hypericibacter sp.]|uniref:aldo/keto reductase n=1 Tax=Hypericibacter sp. TaxID=2705401 RepID=UPI003D6D0430